MFALRANASQEIVKCYYDCSKRISIALHFEEQRVGYLTGETKIMTAHDDNQDNEQTPYSTILEKSTLAKTLKKMYEDLLVEFENFKTEVNKKEQDYLRGKFVFLIDCLPRNKI